MAWKPLPQEAPFFNNIYIDETSTNHRHLVIGGIICPIRFANEFEEDIIKARGDDLPARSRDGSLREIKWTKVSDKKVDAYKRVVLTFFQFANKIPLSDGRLDFHSAVVDTSIKDRGLTEIGFNKEIRTLCLKYARLYRTALFHVYLDQRTTSHKLWHERNHLNNAAHLSRPNKNWPFRRVQFRISHEVQALQVTDILLGALAFRLNGHYDLPEASAAKIELSNYVMKLARISDPFRDTKHLARYTIWHREKPWLKPMLKASRSPTPFRVPPARSGSSA
jgi:hypothetical protein